jgi:UDPglucose 6-dehydrogenase
LAVENKGHSIYAFDESKKIEQEIINRKVPYQEKGLEELISTSKNLHLTSLAEIVKKCSLVFITIEPPAKPEFEGVMPLPDVREDFDYSSLKKAVAAVSEEILKQKSQTTIVVISTVLPRTMRKEIMPLLNQYVSLVYNPYFMRVGTCISDFLHPEMVIMGSDIPEAMNRLEWFYRTIHSAAIVKLTVEEAELTKVGSGDRCLGFG